MSIVYVSSLQAGKDCLDLIRRSIAIDYVVTIDARTAASAHVCGYADFSDTGIALRYVHRYSMSDQRDLDMLMGEFDERVAVDLTTGENARRLREFLRISKNVIGELAPDLIDIFLPGVGLVTKAGALVAGERGRRRAIAPPAAGQPAPGADTSPIADQSRVFEQVTSVLIEVAKKRPLILILDDLHWIDESSASLLFHLARRIEKSRILIVCTYRPEDVAVARSEWRHPLPNMSSKSYLCGHTSRFLRSERRHFETK